MCQLGLNRYFGLGAHYRRLHLCEKKHAGVTLYLHGIQLVRSMACDKELRENWGRLGYQYQTLSRKHQKSRCFKAEKWQEEG